MPHARAKGKGHPDREDRQRCGARPRVAVRAGRAHYPYVVVPLTTGPLAITSATGDTTATLVTGEPYFRPAGVEHDVINPNAMEFVFVEIELKRA